TERSSPRDDGLDIDVERCENQGMEFEPEDETIGDVAAQDSSSGAAPVQLNVQQRDRLNSLLTVLNKKKIAHSDSVARAARLHAAMEGEIQAAEQEMTGTMAAMLESLGLNPRDRSVRYTIDPDTGSVTCQAVVPTPSD